jgi:hypothetical protein
VANGKRLLTLSGSEALLAGTSVGSYRSNARCCPHDNRPASGNQTQFACVGGLLTAQPNIVCQRLPPPPRPPPKPGMFLCKYTLHTVTLSNSVDFSTLMNRLLIDCCLLPLQ